jgi:hypothetical protein
MSRFYQMLGLRESGMSAEFRKNFLYMAQQRRRFF